MVTSGFHRRGINMAGTDPDKPAGEDFSNADCAVIPYILRLELLKLGAIWDRYPSVAAWWERARARPSVKAAIFDRMTEADHAPFKNLAPDPWPKVQELLKAA